MVGVVLDGGCGTWLWTCGTWWYVWYLVVGVVPGGMCVTWLEAWYLVVCVVPGGMCRTWLWAWYLVVCVVPGCGRGTWWYVWYLVVGVVPGCGWYLVVCVAGLDLLSAPGLVSLPTGCHALTSLHPLHGLINYTDIRRKGEGGRRAGGGSRLLINYKTPKQNVII